MTFSRSVACVVGVLTLGLSSAPAEAACDSYVRGISSLSGKSLVSRYAKLLGCDKQVGQDNFPQFMRASGDDQTLIELSLTAIEFNAWNPVWNMLGQITSYEQRDLVAKGVGTACVENEKVIGFLQGAYFALKPIDFQQWDDAVLACEAPAFNDWLVNQVENPPAKLFDDKWNALVETFVRRKGAGALPSLVASGKKAASNGGPFEVVLTQMEASVAPELGEDLKPEDAKALTGSMVELAKSIDGDSARAVANRLANQGADSEAAALLRSIYADRINDGKLRYGAASVEAGTCSGERQVVIHSTDLYNPLTVWDVTAAAEDRMRSFKPRLSKCTVDTPWPVIVSVEPVKSDDEIKSFLDDLTEIWKQKGYQVKVKGEKAIQL